MARHKGSESEPVDIRATLAKQWAEVERRCPPAVDPDLLAVPLVPSRSRLERLQAGEAIELDGWMLPWPHRFGQWDHLRLEADGSLTLLETAAERRRGWASAERSRSWGDEP